MTYPATNLNEAVGLIVPDSNALHNIINGDADSTVTTPEGREVPTVLKAIADSLLFKDPIPWEEGGLEQDPLQLRTFTDGLIYWAPTAQSTYPVAMGVSPIGDSNWKISPIIKAHNSLTNRDEQGAHPVSAIDGAIWSVDTIEDLQGLVGVEGQQVSVASYHGLDDLSGGGTFVWGTGRHNGGTFIDPTRAFPTDWNNQAQLTAWFEDGGVDVAGWERQYSGAVNVKWFGAKGDGGTDDAPPIQAAIDHVYKNEGGAIELSKPSNYYALKSTRTTTTGLESCLVLPVPMAMYGDPISLIGVEPNIALRVATDFPVFSALYLEGFSLYKQITNLDIWGGISPSTPLADYVIYGADSFHANFSLTDSRFYVAKTACVRIATYVSVWNKVQGAYAPIVFKLGGPDAEFDVTTSLTMNSCYALNAEIGFWFGNTTYCTLNSCAVDHATDVPYRIGIARGLAMNACGAESSSRILRINTIQGFSLNTFFTLGIGDNVNPPEALIDIAGGQDATIQGLHLQGSKSYEYKVKLGNAFSTECITVLDSSISPGEVSYVPNFRHSNPFKFVVWDSSNRDFTHNVTDTTSLKAVLATFENTEQNHTQTIQLPDGDLVLDSGVVAFINRVRGSGRIVFKGGTNSRIVTSGVNVFEMRKTPVTLEIVFQDVDIHALVMSEPIGFYINSTGNVHFNNSNITSHNGAVRWGINDKAAVFFDASSSAQTAFLTLGKEYSVTLSPRETAPTGLYPNRSIAYKDNPDATTKGWLRGTGGWFAF